MPTETSIAASKIIRTIINGVRGVGMSEGMRSIFQTRPPRRIPVILSAEEAAAADFDALSSDWAKVCGDLELDPRSWSSVDDFMRDLVADCESDQRAGKW